MMYFLFIIPITIILKKAESTTFQMQGVYTSCQQKIHVDSKKINFSLFYILQIFLWFTKFVTFHIFLF